MILHAHRAGHVIIMPNLIQLCSVLDLLASVQSFFDSNRSRGQAYGYVSAPGSRVQHIKILSDSCVLNPWLPKQLLVVNSHLNGKGFQC